MTTPAHPPFKSHPTARDTPDPTPATPGIRIYAPPLYRYHDDPARWSLRFADTPYAAYACACGESAHATGPRNVADLITRYADHTTTCAKHATPDNVRALRPLVARYTRRTAA
ncbi:hypothetical protein ACIO1C_31120 [Streptomyces sp. NPDC087420]|uniref:hypothetical protein n=1 Tax=Streptomyces sp. NPDC087420 TaxID=3365785 RepID=UPI00383488D7